MLALLSVPLVAQNVVEVASTVVDVFWIGRLGGRTVAAVGLAAPVFSLLLILTIGVPYIGTMIFVSQRIDNDGARRAAFNGVVLGAVLSLVVGGVAVLAAPATVALLVEVRPGPTSATVAAMTVRYLRILAVGLAFASVNDAIEGGVRGPRRLPRGAVRQRRHGRDDPRGRPAPDLRVRVGTRPGLPGAAVASVLGFVAGLLVALGFVYTGRSGRVLTWSTATVRLEELRQLRRTELSPTAQQANRRIAEIVVVAIVFAVGGPAALATYPVGTRVFSPASIPAQGFQSAAQASSDRTSAPGSRCGRRGRSGLASPSSASASARSPWRSGCSRARSSRCSP